MANPILAQSDPGSFRSIWRSNWLDTIYGFSDIDLQKRRWLDPANTNPHWSYIEFMCSYFDDLNLTDGYDGALARGFISNKEAEAVQALHSALDQYITPDEEGFDDNRVLADPAWQAIVQEAQQARLNLFSVIEDDSERSALSGLAKRS